MRNNYFWFVSILTGFLLFTSSYLPEDRSKISKMSFPGIANAEELSGSKLIAGNQKELRTAVRNTLEMRSVMKRLIPAYFNESPVVLNSMLYSTITATWTGALSTDWNNAGNWMGSAVPTSTDIVGIPNVANKPVIMNGTNAVAQSIFIEANSSLTISTTGTLNLEGATGTPSGGIHNLGTLTNNGTLHIGASVSPGQYGLVNEGFFQNNASGVVNINRSAIISLWNRSSGSVIINIGTINCGALDGIGTGIYNEGAIQNNGGNIEIDRTAGASINNRSNSTINNLGKILIGQASILSGTGIYNFGHIQNFSAGEIEIDRTNSGIFNTTENSIASSFINSGSIAIGQTASVNGPGIYNNSSGSTVLFENNTGAEIFVDRTNTGIHNSNNCTINNSGLIYIGNIGSFSSFGLGIYNLGTFNNESSAEIKIDKCPRVAMHHQTGTFTNGGKITVGISEVISGFDPGVYLDGPFTNMVDGELHIDRYSRGALQVAFSGSLTNAGLIMIGQEETGGNNGLFNNGTLENQGTGEIRIDNISNSSNTNGIYNGSGRSFTNAGKIFIGSTVSGGSTGFYDSGNTVNSGEIHIDNIIGGTFNRHGLRNTSGSFTNTGKIMLGASGTIGEWGIWNSSTFNNNAGGEISIDRSITSGLRNGSFGFGGTFTNIGKLTIGENSGVGDWGIWNDSPFINSGELSISNASVTALRHESTTFTNSGQITLGEHGSAGQWGLWSQASFTNESDGEVYINETSNTGLLVFSNTFSNRGTVSIGVGSSVGDQAIYLVGTLENNTCAKLNIYAVLNNAGTLTNFGMFLADTDGTHINTAFTNSGVLAYPQGNPIPNVTNEEIIIGPTTDNDCQNISTAFEIAGTSLSILGIYFDPEATLYAGSYNMLTNIFTADPPFENGVYDLYVEIEHSAENCNYIVPWQLTGEDCCELPVAICQPFSAVLDGEGVVAVFADDIDNGSTAGCGLQSKVVSPDSFDCSHVGSAQVVTLIVTDIRGTSSSCTAIVTVTDETLPTIICPDMQILALGEECTAILPDYSDLAIKDDNCGIQSVTQSPEAGTIQSDAGNLSVTLTVTDVNGLENTCSFTVTKVDNTPPLVQCFDQIIVFNGEMSIDLDPGDLAEVDDNCGVQSVVLSADNVSPDQVGQTVPVQVTVTDINSNTSICTSQISVTGLPTGWSQNINGVGCTDGNDIDYDASSQVWTATGTNCYYSSPFTSDATAFAQRTLCGNGSITAQVTGISDTSPGWAGVVMRENNAAGAKKAQLTTNMAGNQSRREFRVATNGMAIPQNFPAQGRFWLRVVRTGNQFILYNSSNGAQWYMIGAQTIAMNTCIEIGLVATNYNSNSTVTATFANVSYTGNGPIQNSPLPGNGNVAASTQYHADFSVYPNPTAGELKIDLNEYSGKNAQIEIYSLECKMLKMIRIDEVWDNTETIQLDAYPGGMYFVKLRSKGLPDVTKRVVLSKN